MSISLHGIIFLWFTGVGLQCVLSGIELWVYAWMYWIIQHKSVIFSECITKACFVLYRAESNLSDRSKRFTLYTLTYLFIPTPTRLLWKALSLLKILREDYSLTYMHVTIPVSSQVLVYTVAWTGRGGDNELGFSVTFHSVHREAKFEICLWLWLSSLHGLCIWVKCPVKTLQNVI